MKHIFWIAALALALSGCATTVGGVNYSQLAREQTFESLFPTSSSDRTFADLDEAFAYIRTGQEKVRQVGGKTSVQGLSARLKGNPVKGTAPVTVVSYLYGYNEKSQPAGDTADTLAVKVKKAISVSLIFMVFYGDRAVSISDFYLSSSYVYSSNSQVRTLGYKEQTYTTEYPVGWGTEQALGYLAGKLN